MQEGNFRCDANVSVRPVGAEKSAPAPRSKNVNSFGSIEKAIEYEINRQIQLIQSGGKVVQETAPTTAAKGVTLSMRGKEEAHDYRYFPEPDLCPWSRDRRGFGKTQANQPELPHQKRERFVNELGIPAYDATVITESKKLAQFLKKAAAHCG
jgi:aspartyl-tRNA(Asn)/glutamyl-tRNA(Gln) amidotransferase subunit B